MKVSKSIVFLVKSFLGNFYRHLVIFSGHTATIVAKLMVSRKIPPALEEVFCAKFY